MDGSRFDALVRSLAALAPRRAALRALAGGALAIGVARSGTTPTAAQEAESASCSEAGYRCERNRQCCSGDCGRNQCRCPEGGFCANPPETAGCGPRCFCFVDTRGRNRCADLSGQRCPARSQCDGDGDCPRGEFCAANQRCCGREPNGRPINDCLPLCKRTDIGPEAAAAGDDGEISYGR